MEQRSRGVEEEKRRRKEEEEKRREGRSGEEEEKRGRADKEKAIRTSWSWPSGIKSPALCRQRSAPRAPSKAK